MSWCYGCVNHTGRSTLTHLQVWTLRCPCLLLFSVIAPPPNPCADGSHSCAPADQARCIYHGGSTFSCTCLPGYTGSGHQCTGEYLRVVSLSDSGKLPCMQHPHVTGTFLKRTSPFLDSHSLGIVQRAREKLSSESKSRAKGIFPWTRLVSIWWGRSRSTRKPLRACSQPSVP